MLDLSWKKMDVKLIMMIVILKKNTNENIGTKKESKPKLK